MKICRFFLFTALICLLTSCLGEKESTLTQVNINNTSAEALKLIQGFDDRIIREITNHLLFYGPFNSVDEMVEVSGYQQQPSVSLTVETTGGDTSDPAAPIIGKIAFTREVNGIEQLFVQENYYATPKQVTFGSIDIRTIRWSPEGKRIAYVGLESSGWPSISILNLETGESYKKADIMADIPNINWFNDGLNLFYIWHWSREPYQMYKLDVQNNTVGIGLSQEVQGTYFFDFHPYKPYLALSSIRRDDFGIKIVNTSQWQEDPQWNTTQIPLNVDNPVWSPTGDKLGYVDFNLSEGRPCFVREDGNPWCIQINRAVSEFVWLDSWHIIFPVDNGTTWNYYAVDIDHPEWGSVLFFKDMKHIDIWFPAPSQENPFVPTEQTSTKTVLTPEVTKTPSIPTGKLLYRRMDNQNQPQIWMREEYLGQGIQLTNGDFPAIGPSWAPDGSGRILYRSGNPDSPQIFMIEQPGALPKQITEYQKGCLYSSWTPDAQQMLAFCFVADYSELIVFNNDGYSSVIMGSIYYTEIPKISPDGQKLSFSSGMIESPGIFVASLDNPYQYSRVATTDYYNDYEWSPDSDKILYRNCQEGIGCSLYLAGLDGNNTQVYSTSRKIRWMDWPANSSWILFTMDNPDVPLEDLYALNLADAASEPVLLVKMILGDIDLSP